MKKPLLFLFVLAITILGLTACSKDRLDPTVQIEKYIQLWHEQNFTQMYELLTDESKQQYSTEDFIDRYEKIYKDLAIDDLKITYSELTDEQINEAIEKGEANFQIDVEMNSIAGPIQFSNTLHLTLVEHSDEEKEAEWLVEWNPGLIFPDLADGGKIRIETEQPRRGEILDRNQMPLALNDIAYEIGVVPNNFQNEEAEKEHIARLLNMSVSAIDEQLSAEWVQEDHFVPLNIIPKSDEKTLNELLTIPAVTTQETTGRVYPAGEAAAHLTGYIGKITEEEMKEHKDYPYKESDLIGKRGLELLYEKQLRGEPGVKVYIEKETDDGKEEIVLAEKPVQHGEHVHVNIDINIQEKIFATFENHPGNAAAIDPKTGEILALVSSPSFDPNEFVYGITQNRWDQLMEDEDEPFVNRFAATYAPGSVMKLVTAAIGLNNSVIDPDESIKIEGFTWGKDNWGDYEVRRVTDTGKPVNLRDAIVYSDNIYFAMKAVELGHEKYTEGLKQYGFMEQIPIDFPISVSQISNEGHLQDEVLLANTSYGQGEIEVSTLHMALTYTPILNKGNLIKPSFLTTDSTGEIWKEHVLSEEHAELLQKHLREVVTEGTGRVANIDDLPISGKTGTAELKLTHGASGHQHGWFVGYPTDDQDILIAMMMEKVENKGGSSFVTEKVAEIFKEIKGK